MPISEELATLISSIYSANTSSASAISYNALQIKAHHEPAVKRAAYLGKAVSSTTQAVTHTLVAAGLQGARGLSEATLAASGLSFLCSLPSAIETIQNLGQSNPKESVKEIYKRSKTAHEQALKQLKTSLLVTGEIKHDNILQLMYNLPLDIIQDKAHHNLFPSIHDKLVRKKRGDAKSFYKKHLASGDNRQKLISGFLNSLKHIDDKNMKSPPISIGEIASYLSLLDPEKDETEIAAFSSLFNELLIPFRQTLSQDIDCAAAMDESNHALLTLMADTYTRRANRKKMQAKQLNTAKHVLTGVGVVLSGALAVYSAGLSVPVTALLATKLASSSVGLLSTSVRIAKLVQEGACAHDISELLTPQAITELEQSNLGGELLKSSIVDVDKYKASLLQLKEKIDSLVSQVHSESYDIKQTNLFLLKQFETRGTLKRLLEDENFLDSISQKIRDGMDAPTLYKAMIEEVQRLRTMDFSYQTTKLESLTIITSLLMNDDQLTRETFISMAKKGELHTYLSATLEGSRKEAEACYQKVRDLDEQFDVLTKLSDGLSIEERQVHLKSHGLMQKHVGDLSIEKLLRANDYLEIIEDSQEKMALQMTKAQELIKRLEGGTEVSHLSFAPL